MRAATVEALTLFPLASSANCFFHASKPAAVLPHCAAPAALAIHTTAAKAATVTALNCPPVVIQNLRPCAPDETLARHLCRDEASPCPRGLQDPSPRCGESASSTAGRRLEYEVYSTRNHRSRGGLRFTGEAKGSPVHRQHPAME